MSNDICTAIRNNGSFNGSSCGGGSSSEGDIVGSWRDASGGMDISSAESERVEKNIIAPLMAMLQADDDV